MTDAELKKLVDDIVSLDPMSPKTLPVMVSGRPKDVKQVDMIRASAQALGRLKTEVAELRNALSNTPDQRDRQLVELRAIKTKLEQQLVEMDEQIIDVNPALAVLRRRLEHRERLIKTVEWVAYRELAEGWVRCSFCDASYDDRGDDAPPPHEEHCIGFTPEGTVK